jgi:hypothetical protein
MRIVITIHMNAIKIIIIFFTISLIHCSKNQSEANMNYDKINNFIHTSKLDSISREIKFVKKGMHGYLDFRKGDLYDLLLSIDYLIVPVEKIPIPPLNAINDVLITGEKGECIWNPFQISEKEYIIFINKLKSENNNKYFFIESPSWIKTFEDWQLWLWYRNYNVPIDEHRKLLNEYNKWDNLRKIAQSQNNKNDLIKYHAKASLAGVELANFLQEYEVKSKSPEEIRKREPIVKDIKLKMDKRLQDLEDNVNNNK